ncbi:DUF2829 domain-containing protein [Pasteurella multocida]
MGINFGEAVQALKGGKTVCRSGWNGKGMFLFLVKGQEIDVKTQHGGELEWCDFIVMKTADNKLVPWLASQTDVLATDWQVL